MMKERVHSPAIQGSREQRRIAVRRERVRQRWQRRLQRGQTLVIFALSLTVLLALAGLSVDVSRLYDLYARLQRAAEAGALAGVLYLPNNYGTPLPAPGDGHTAISRASIEVVKNGIGSAIADTVTTDCPNPVTSVTIAVCQVQVGQLPALRVTVTQTASVALMGGLGVGPTTISATGEASYLPPFALGVSPSAPNYFGDEGECGGASPGNCNPTGNGAHGQNFIANINGPGDLKEMGDPFVYCEEGPSQGPPSGSADQSLALTPLPATTYNGLPTNHPQYNDASSLGGLTSQHCGQPGAGGSPPGNPDQQPPGYDGPMTDGTSHPGAYNYGIVVPPADAGASLWIYNGNYTPYIDSNLNNCHGRQAIDTFFKNLSCNGFYNSYGNLTPSGSPTPSWNGKFDDPSLYFNTTFTLYAVNNTYFRNLDQIVTCTGSGFGTATCPPAATGMNQASNKVQWTFRPYDQMTQDLQQHTCGSGGTYDLSGGSSYSGSGPPVPGKGCVPTTPPCLSTRVGGAGGQNWCNIANNLPAGTYRLAVEATSFDQQSGTSLLSGWGQHGYGLKLCGPTLTTYTPGAAVGCASGGNIAAWNNMDLLFAFPAANSNNTLPVADIPSAYAGRSVTFSLFDLCDSVVGNNCWAEVIPPTTNDTGTPNPTITVNYPSGVRTGTDPCSSKPAIFGASNGDNIYNGLWLNTTVQIPPNYQGGVWQLNICTDHGTAQDVVGIKMTLVGSSVFLLPPV